MCEWISELSLWITLPLVFIAVSCLSNIIENHQYLREKFKEVERERDELRSAKWERERYDMERANQHFGMWSDRDLGG